MALITCPKCGSKISDRATQCPKCNHIVGHNSTYNQQFMNNKPKRNRGGITTSIVVAIVILGCATGYYFYDRHKTTVLVRQKLQQQRQDSIALVQGLMAEREAFMADSLEQVAFRNEFAEVSDLLYMGKEGMSEFLTPMFRNDMDKQLKQKGYTVTQSREGYAEGEGGEYNEYTKTIYEKEWTRSNTAALWSKITYVSGGCGGITIEFCDNEAKERFLESCKKFGYKSKHREGNETMLTIVPPNNENYFNFHENNNGVIIISKQKVFISYYCI